MKILYTCCFYIIISFSSKSQQAIPIDSLKKYSYVLSGFAPSGQIEVGHQGTGFFVKKANKVLLVTANHVLSGCRNFFEEPRGYPEKMNVYLNDATGHFTFKRLPIYIQNLRDTGICPMSEEQRDIGIYQVPDSFRNRIFSFENIIKPDSGLIKGTVVIFGFPMKKNGEDGGFVLKESSLIKIEKYNILYNHFFKDKNGKTRYDDCNYIISTKDIKIDLSLGGYSGSPVFEKVYNKLLFIGMLTACNIENNYLIIMKSQYIFDKLKAYN
jgi:hypothetical protein